MQRARAEETRWSDILRHYETLLAIHPSPVVHLNRAVALKLAVGPTAALESLEQNDLGRLLDDYHYYHATRGELLLDLGRRDEARQAFERALKLAANEQEIVHLKRRIAVVEKVL
jgi:RNA polymerase sigma-70 factor (ECF subfamily)